MALASMIALDKDALICDLAETYSIYDYRSLPASTVATFSVGLRDDSRIKTKIRGETVSTDTLLLGMIYDNVSRVLVALGSLKEPKLISEVLLGETKKEEEKETKSFESPESFEEERKRIIEGIRNVGN